jgi:hypothetical protein
LGNCREVVVDEVATHNHLHQCRLGEVLDIIAAIHAIDFCDRLQVVDKLNGFDGCGKVSVKLFLCRRSFLHTGWTRTNIRCVLEILHLSTSRTVKQVGGAVTALALASDIDKSFQRVRRVGRSVLEQRREDYFVENLDKIDPSIVWIAHLTAASVQGIVGSYKEFLDLRQRVHTHGHLQVEPNLGGKLLGFGRAAAVEKLEFSTMRLL